jgi:hypothetical protein
MSEASGEPGYTNRMRTRLCPRRLSALCLLIFVLAPPVLGQNQSADEATESKRQSQQPKKEQLNVNWLYGAYVPKEAALVSLTVHQREKLFMRQTFTTPGIYIKSGFLALLDQASGKPMRGEAAWTVTDAARLPIMREPQFRTPSRPPGMLHCATNRL